MKKDFPIFKTKKGQKPLVYLDSASTSQKPKQVIETIVDFYSNYNANTHRGIYDISEKATIAFEEAREKTADFIGAKSSSEIIFTRNTTESINLIAYTFASQNINRGDNIIATIMEHHSNFVPWQVFCKRKGVKFLVAPITKEGKLNLEKLFNLINKKTKLIAITHASNMLGTINPVKDIINQAKKKNPDIKVLIDGAQSAAHFPVNVQGLGCDFFVFSSHKLLGPMGVGILYIKEDILENLPPFLFGGHMIKSVSEKETIFNDIPWRLEAGTQDVAGVVGFGSAIDYLNKISMKEVEKYILDLTIFAKEKLEKIKNIEIYGPKNPKERVGLFSFNLKGIHSHDVAQLLNEDNVAIRAGHHCALPVHNFLNIVSSARASFHIYNTKEDIDKLADSLKRAQKFFKN